MILTLIRHTAVATPKGICYGMSDVALHDTFSTEVDAIKKKVDSTTFDTIISSPLTRCTTLAHTLFPTSVIKTDTRIAEMHFGDWEMESWNAIYDSSYGKKWFKDYININCPNGESFSTLMKRTTACIESLPEKSSIVIITHAGVIRALLATYTSLTPIETFDKTIEYGDIITLEIPLTPEAL
ncbi:MAG: alpha-ribazole phosphatase family protein [Fibrobacterales bacterium]